MWHHLKTKHYKAKKHHTCYACGSLIMLNEIYAYITSITDGNDFQVIKLHECCHQYANYIEWNDGEGIYESDWNYNSIQEWYQEEMQRQEQHKIKSLGGVYLQIT